MNPAQSWLQRIQGGTLHSDFQSGDDIHHELDFEQIIVRHGPDPAIRGLIGDTDWAELRQRWQVNPDWPLEPKWSHSTTAFYPPNVNRDLTLSLRLSPVNTLTQRTNTSRQIRPLTRSALDTVQGPLVSLLP